MEGGEGWGGLDGEGLLLLVHCASDYVLCMTEGRRGDFRKRRS